MKVLEIRKGNLRPFEIAKIEEENGTYCIILIGNTKIATKFKDFETANKYIKSRPYELIFAIAEAVYNFKSEKNGNN